MAGSAFGDFSSLEKGAGSTRKFAAKAHLPENYHVQIANIPLLTHSRIGEGGSWTDSSMLSLLSVFLAIVCLPACVCVCMGTCVCPVDPKREKERGDHSGMGKEAVKGPSPSQSLLQSVAQESYSISCLPTMQPCTVVQRKWGEAKQEPCLVMFCFLMPLQRNSS